jgi:polysaccharide pyruvyl transferase WcaK-like protein
VGTELQRIGLINDTSVTGNPGCAAVCRTIEDIAAALGGRITARLPVGFWADSFAAMATNPKQCTVREPDSFPIGSSTAPGVDFKRWQSIVAQLEGTDENVRAFLESCDLVIVNGEGSIHHNFRRSLALLALMHVMGRRGRRFVLVNSTIQAMQPELLQAVLPAATHRHVREDRSRDYLSNLSIDSSSGPDLAFHSIEKLTFDPQTGQREDCLVTAGVLSGERALRALFASVREVGLAPTYLCIGDGGERPLAERVCASENVPIAHAGDFSLADLLRYIGGFQIAVSGRHHINMYLMRAGVPFLPLPSNTWKVEGTLQQVGYPVPIVHRPSMLPADLASLYGQRHELRERCAESFARGADGVSRVIRELLECLS